MQKNYFGFLDSRNTKYQGVLRNDHFDGIGILIDQQLTTVLSTWKKYAISGPSVIIFSTLEIFFGEIQDGMPKGVACFQYSHKQKLFIKFKPNKTTQSTITQIALITHNKQITQLQKQNSNKSQFKIRSNFHSNNSQDMLKILSGIFNEQIKKHQIDLIEYLSYEFFDQMEVFQLSGGGREMFFGFKGVSSLGFKLENDGVPIAVGCWNLFPRNLMFGRKIYYNPTFPQKTKIQQGNFWQSSQLYKWTKSQGPSIDCIKSVEDYFKKSTTFRNEFIKLDQVKKLFKLLKQIEEQIKVQTGKKYGQTLLENKYGSSYDNNEQAISKEYTLEQVKQQIYKAAARKHSSFKTTHRSPFQSSFKKQNKYIYEDSNRSRGKYTDQYHCVNQFSLSYQAKDPYEGLISQKEEVPEIAFTERSFKDTSGKTKMDLLKNVNEIIKTRKQNERISLSELIKNDNNNFGGSGLKQKYAERQTDEYISPMTKRYRKYELKAVTNEREQKYETKTSPFMIETSNDLERKQNIRVVPQRRIKYLQAEKENQPQLETIRLQRYDLFKTGADKIIQQKQAEISEQGQSKAHSNLAKYKDRLKDSTPSKQSYQKVNRYHYLNEFSKPEDGQIPTSQKLMDELRLFDIDNSDSKKFRRSFTENNEIFLQKDYPITYIASEPRQRPKYTKASYEDTTSNEMARGRPRIYDPNEKRIDNVVEDEGKLVKMYSFQDRSLSDKLNINPQNLQQGQKKPKRTYQYVVD